MKVKYLFILPLLFIILSACGGEKSTVDKAYDIAKENGSAVEVANLINLVNPQQLDIKEMAKFTICVAYVGNKVPTDSLMKADVNTDQFSKVLLEGMMQQAKYTEKQKEEFLKARDRYQLAVDR